MDEKDVIALAETVNQTTLVTEDESKKSELLNKATNSEVPKYNKRALSKDAETYELEKFEKKALLILNQKHFTDRAVRTGTEKDEDKLKETFSRYGFDVDVGNNLTHAEIMLKLEKFSSQDFTDHGCVAVAVLTHGAEGGLIGAKDKAYNESDIIKHFKVNLRPTLVTKPKILIIQACRGKNPPKGVFVFEHRGPTKKDDDDSEIEKPYTLPVESDMIVLHSSYIGKPSHRDEINGSWFIQVLCQKINDLAETRDLESIMTEVKRMVAIDLFDEEANTTTSELEVNKQMPVITSTLIRKLFLRKFGDQPVCLYDRSPSVDRQMSVASHIQSDCSCFLGHFEYIRNCLKLYLEAHPDIAGQRIYDLAKTYDDSEYYNEVKKVMLDTITDYFQNKCSESFKFLKFLHLYTKKC